MQKTLPNCKVGLGEMFLVVCNLQEFDEDLDEDPEEEEPNPGPRMAWRKAFFTCTKSLKNQKSALKKNNASPAFFSCQKIEHLQLHNAL